MTRLRIAGLTGFLTTLLCLAFGLGGGYSGILGLVAFLVVMGVGWLAEAILDGLDW